jgi:AcrR family transcriptional regulator
MVLIGTECKRNFLVKRKQIETAASRGSDNRMRERVLGAAFSAFQEFGYGGASTIEIATRAKVSKRELYKLFGNKRAMLTACITERARRMRLPLDLPASRDRQALAKTLTTFGKTILREVCDPSVLAVYPLAITESDPEIAHALDSAGREANRAALVELLTKAQAHGLFGAGEPKTMAARFFALLWSDLLVRLLLRVTEPPTLKEMERMAGAATEVLLRLFPDPNGERQKVGGQAA